MYVVDNLESWIFEVAKVSSFFSLAHCLEIEKVKGRGIIERYKYIVIYTGLVDNSDVHNQAVIVHISSVIRNTINGIVT